jgi:hypothetical protein
MIPEHRQAKRVKGAAGDLLSRGPQRGAEAFRDLVGRLVGEGDGADPPRLDAEPADEMLDALDEAEGLPRSRPGDDQHGARRGFDGTKLGGGRDEGHWYRRN